MQGGLEVVVASRQRARRLDRKALRKFCAWVVAGLDAAELGIHFVSPREMARVHETYMGIPGSTDVITFDHGSQPPRSVHGEIYISVEDAIGQAQTFGTSWPEEIARYIIHGVLHLQGCDDLDPAARRKMKKLENQQLRRARREFDFAAFEKG